MTSKYVHTNLIARDWRRLLAFQYLADPEANLVEVQHGSAPAAAQDA